MTALPKRTLGRTGLEVTTLGFGAMEIRGPRIWGGRAVTDEQAKTILHAVLDSGINFIDTSNDYGRSEEFMGRFLAGRRKEYVLATKCGCKVTPAGDHDETPHEFTRANIERGVEESLKRLKTECIDILQLHNPSVQQVKDGDVVRVLQDLQRAGKTRFIAISSTLPHLPEFLALGVFDTFQIPYSALEREHEDLISKVALAGAGAIVLGGVAQGSPAKEQGRRWDAWQTSGLDTLRGGMSRQEFVLRYTMSHPALHTNIVGTLHPEHLAENLAIVKKGPLPPDLYAETKKRLSVAGIKPA